MRECCQEYEEMLALLQSVKTRLGDDSERESIESDLQQVIAFVQAEFDAHVDRAGEAAWRND